MFSSCPCKTFLEKDKELWQTILCIHYLNLNGATEKIAFHSHVSGIFKGINVIIIYTRGASFYFQ